MEQLEIRALVDSDEPQWRRLWTLYLEFYSASVSEDVYSTTFARLLSPDENEFHGLLASKNGKPVGITHYLFHRHCWQVENVCYLQDLYVDAEQRGTGTGRALIEAVYDKADAAGFPSVYWHTQSSNKVGRRLYDRVAQLTPFLMYSRNPENRASEE